MSRRFVKDSIRPISGMRILDIGCGTAAILKYLPEDVKYYGFDSSKEYIDKASNEYGDKGHFTRVSVEDTRTKEFPTVDVAIAIGVLHHLADEEAKQLFELAYKTLVSGGRLLTIDGCFDYKQSNLAKFILKRDRGQNVRTESGYRMIASQVFDKVSTTIDHKPLLIPFTHCRLECEK